MRHLLLLTGLVLFGHLLAACGNPGPDTVVLVTIDTLRADHTSAHGYFQDTTPNLKALAARGTAFDLCYAQHVETGPSISSIMTSRYPREIGVRINDDVLPEEFPTLAERFRDAGYETAGFVSAHVVKPHCSGLERGFEVYDHEMNAPNLGHENFERRARDTVGRALKWLEENEGRRRFLWVHLYDPHGKYDPIDPANRDRFRASKFPKYLPPEKIVKYQRYGNVTDAGDYIARYDGEIFEADEALGRLIAAVGPDALIAVGSDHGESLGEDDYWFRHGSLLNRASLHVPLVIAGPGVPAGKRQAALVRNLDVAPTLLELAGLDPLPEARGRLLLTAPDLPPAPSFAETRPDPSPPDRTGLDVGPKVSLTNREGHFVWRLGRAGCPHPDLERWVGEMPDRRFGSEADPSIQGLPYVR